jgi:predicted GNAT family acetyltransferase
MAFMDSFRDNAAAGRYELDHEHGPSFAEYQDRGEARLIMHVETPDAARGKGYAAQLMAAVVESARAAGLKLVPRCSYAVAYFRRHQDAADVLAP